MNLSILGSIPITGVFSNGGVINRDFRLCSKNLAAACCPRRVICKRTRRVISGSTISKGNKNHKIWSNLNYFKHTKSDESIFYRVM